MAIRKRQTIAEIFEEGRLIDRAVELAARDAVLLHKRMGKPMPVWRDGRTVWIQPEEIEVPEVETSEV